MAPKACIVLLLVLICPLFSFASAKQCGSQAGGNVCPKNLCCSQFGFCGTTSDYCACGTCQGAACNCTPGTQSPSGVSSIITRSIFDRFLSQRTDSRCPSKGFYTYNAFVEAAAAFGAFGTSSDPHVAKRELAAFFANVAHETSSGCHVEQIAKPTSCMASARFPCAKGKQYYGRGPLQLSWNFNYGAAGQALGFDGINNPDIVAKDPTISFKTAIWFWMTQKAQATTCHNAMVNGAGFGETIRVINGDLECGRGANLGEQRDRIHFYTSFCSILGVQPDRNLSC